MRKATCAALPDCKDPETPLSQEFSVLLVEDDDDARSNMSDILSLDGYRIDSVSHCLPAIEAVESRHYDAVIVDWSLPDGSGGDLIPLILKELPDTPVVVVTGMREFEAAVASLKMGAYDFLLKPINADVLRSVISRLVERKKHLQEIERAHQKLVDNERLAAIGQTVAGLAHESRNAFQRSHACLAELTLDLQDDPEKLRLVQKVQKALDDINFLLEEVRNYAAPVILERRECHIAELVRETWQGILLTRQPHPAPRFVLDCTEDFPDRGFVDVDRIQQVLRNLLENALFACGDPGEIRVSLSANSDSTISIEVCDDGAGVPSDQREAIFRPFFTTKTKGTGLGLAICRRIVEAHMGDIRVEDAVSGGARFVVEIPERVQIRSAERSVPPDPGRLRGG
jgi:signal transduction histidine kinase